MGGLPMTDEDKPWFNGDAGRTPQMEAKRYVYRIIYRMLERELSPEERDGWMFGGVEFPSDRRNLTKAIKAVMKEMKRRGEGT